MHEDVRSAEIREALVGDLLPQEEFRCEGSGVTKFKIAFAQDKPNRISPEVGSIPLTRSRSEFIVICLGIYCADALCLGSLVW